MTGQVYPTSAWLRARAARASAGRAPRLAVTRMIVLREYADGRCAVCLQERRFGVWQKPEWLSGVTTYAKARAAVETAWRRHRLPVVFARFGERTLHPFHINRPRPIGGAA
jgi:hypothetical protein